MGASSLKPTGSPAPLPAAPGQRIGDKYVVLHLMAQGGMAWVAAARHVDLDEIVAIKFLKTDFAVQPEIVARFAREAKTAMQIRSDHCVRIMDVGFDSVLGPFIVMEHLEGYDLAGLIAKEGRLAPRRAADLILQVCDALAAAHVLGIIHRDVKPENVFVCQHGDMEVVRVLDFGISKATVTGKVFNTDLSVLKTQSLLGSPVYMSPEQMRGKDVDMRSDTWSVGATLYEALVGQVAFNAASVTEICSMVLESDPALLPDYVPAGLRRVVMRCLEKDPRDRFQNVAELALALVPFAPSGSRLWAERVVSILKAYGVKIDASSIQSQPPPPDSDDPTEAMLGTPAMVDVEQDPADRAFGTAVMTTPTAAPMADAGAGLVSAPKRRSVALLTFFAVLLTGSLGAVAYLGMHAKPSAPRSIAAATAATPASTGSAAAAMTAATGTPAPPPTNALPATPSSPVSAASVPQVAVVIPPTSPFGRVPRAHGGAPKPPVTAHEPPQHEALPPPPVAAPPPTRAPAEPVDTAPTPAPAKSGRARIIDDAPRPKLVD